ncbi:predicted protein, partial [Nematostella vectensis]
MFRGRNLQPILPHSTVEFRKNRIVQLPPILQFRRAREIPTQVHPPRKTDGIRQYFNPRRECPNLNQRETREIPSRTYQSRGEQRVPTQICPQRATHENPKDQNQRRVRECPHPANREFV